MRGREIEVHHIGRRERQDRELGGSIIVAVAVLVVWFITGSLIAGVVIVGICSCFLR